MQSNAKPGKTTKHYIQCRIPGNKLHMIKRSQIKQSYDIPVIGLVSLL